jgi:multicomponent Na+:H+ antiporter subunit D
VSAAQLSLAPLWPVLVPLAGGVLAYTWRRWAQAIGVLVSLALLPLSLWLAAEVRARGTVTHALGGYGEPLGIELVADGLSALWLLAIALVGSAVAVYAAAYFGASRSQARSYWPLWLFLAAGLNAVALSGDLFNVYVAFELSSLAAVGLVAVTRGADALAASLRYLLVGLLGSLMYLAGVALIYGAHGALSWRVLDERPLTNPTDAVAFGLMAAGLLVKTGVAPLHGWLPTAHSAAPAPASAVLSGLVVKASYLVLLRLALALPVARSTPYFVLVLGLLGVLGVVWGATQAARQRRLKMVIAYSTVAQVGYLLLGLLLIDTPGEQSALLGVAYLVLAHGCAKAALFLAVGNVQRALGHDRLGALWGLAGALPVSVLAFGLAAASIIGLPPSGGFIAKWLLLQAALLSEHWVLAALVPLGGLAGSVYLFRALGRMMFAPPRRKRPLCPVPRRMEWAALGLALASTALGLASKVPLSVLSEVAR